MHNQERTIGLPVDRLLLYHEYKVTNREEGYGLVPEKGIIKSQMGNKR
jgi:hypothetical protein